jgi:hypothetical protein
MFAFVNLGSFLNIIFDNNLPEVVTFILNICYEQPGNYGFQGKRFFVTISYNY